MNQKSTQIEHPGIITKVHAHYVEVMVLSQSACSTCHAKGACSMAEMEEKHVNALKTPGYHYAEGQHVTVYMRQNLGNLAVFLGYIFPFILLVVMLFGLTAAGLGEGKAALAALFTLVPYYTTLYFFREKLGKTFVFYAR